jgi:hypothetical protein
MTDQNVFLIDLRVRASECPDDQVKYFLEQQGIEVLGCNGYEDPDSEY